jgi:hypothetical protein
MRATRSMQTNVQIKDFAETDIEEHFLQWVE